MIVRYTTPRGWQSYEGKTVGTEDMSVVARGQGWVEGIGTKGHGQIFGGFWKCSIYPDHGGGSTTSCVCRNLKKYTLKEVNITICELNLIFFNGEKKIGISTWSSNLLKGNQPGSSRVKIQIQLFNQYTEDHLV